MKSLVGISKLQLSFSHPSAPPDVCTSINVLNEIVIQWKPYEAENFLIITAIQSENQSDSNYAG